MIPPDRFDFLSLSRLDQAKTYLRWAQTHPAEWIERVLGCELWDMQRQVCRSIVENERTIVASGHALGKDHLSGRLVLWFMCSFPNCKVITTGPKDQQVVDVIWSHNIRTPWNESIGGEDSKLKGILRLLLGDRADGIAPLTKRLEFTDNWEAVGFKSQDYRPERISGYHAPHVLVVVTEASGVVDQTMWNAIRGLMSCEHPRLLVVGNPIDNTCQFARFFRNPQYKCFKFSCWESPNVQTGVYSRKGKILTLEDFKRGLDPDKIEEPGRNLPQYPGMCAWDYPWKTLIELGSKDSEYITRVKGDFSEATENQLITQAMLNNARGVQDEKTKKWIGFAEPTEAEMVVLGLDPSSGHGPDYTGWSLRHGPKILDIWKTHDDLTTTAGKIRYMVEVDKQWIDEIRVDCDGGFGDGVVSRLREYQEMGDLSNEIEIVELHSAGPAHMDEKKYADRRSEAWGQVAKMFDDGEIDLSAVENFDFEVEATSVRYKIVNGRIKIEQKEKTKQRLDRSPDLADAFIYSLCSVSTGLQDIVWADVRPM